MKYLHAYSLIHDVARAGSIRKAAEDMNITSSALNRQIQRLEEEFGTQIFERLPRGVRLNPAGELLLQHVRSQRADLDRVRNQVADLSGERRGHVTIGCSQGLNPLFLPDQISRYRAKHPGVTFSVRLRDRTAAEHDLRTFSSDIALVFEPIHLADFEILKAVPQPVCAVMAADHPLAQKPGLRLRDCLGVPHVIPSAEYGVRHLLELATRGRSRGLSPVVEADSFELMRRYVLYEKAVCFQIPIGLQPGGDPRLVVRELDKRDLPVGTLLLGQLRGRTLPVASAKFAHQLAAALEAFDETEPPR
ncbi:LysR family transcriptional regulator [Gemmobacter aquaticus]|uniref:LysR family transcriptional regulator n=1 Tax=Gemmobacter aquaticus TaxID=490185 RepID=A0A917YLS0_9RHOB|nr:LysR family transcriptional regulator [Gemmobacter aquaticus]GGO37092.1 LysR family transcriptional regulator [Gemmobacter aquaticus]